MSIVVGVDNGPGGQLAVRWAVDEALLRGRPLRIVHVSTGMEDDPAEPARTGRLRTVAPGLRGYLDAMNYARDRVPDDMLSGIHPQGPATRVLLKESADAELLVVGSRGRPPLAAVMGSVSSAVAAHAAPPTVVVRGYEDEGTQRGGIVVGVDGSTHAARALQFALVEARLRRTDLVVVQGRGATSPTVDELVAAGTVRGSTVRLHLVRNDQEPAGVLIDRTRTATLTVVGSRGHSGVASVLLGSVSQAVLRHAHGPVAVVH
ncbi:universal stress protein [Jiangella mangrovi]|uniref:Nucleotide-binding universal stress UspA family protein n=1 Tax=Jiangella mangrovi TaxID=1524084 RepID=A0A7W9GRN3_9ACTN|nr:nucleotide-binding universal stress UspA family protein [Jiangella mangrovi]